MKKTFILIWITLLLLSSTTGCNKDEIVKNGQADLNDAYEKLRVGVVLKALDSEHWQTMKKGADKAAKDLGVDVIVLAPDKEANVDMQFRIIEDLILHQLDAICIAPCDSANVTPIIKEANTKDIPVFTIDTNADTEVISFIGTNNYLAGKMAGERMLDILDGKGSIVLITGVLEQQTHRDRCLGFKEVLEGSEIKIIEQRQANSETELAMKVMNQLIKEHNNIDAVFVTNALMGLGVLEAINDNGKTDEIKVIGFDIQQELLESIKNGSVDSVIAQNPYSMGYDTVKAAVTYLRGGSVESYIDTGTELVTNQNVNKYIELFGY
ncbi:MAG TPA: sugar ABC transporter substrate-binding protein [Clostridia bacterium]|nr:sugar ABC transporter substrate-binding protein [Clostridia bacterium]